MIKLSHIVFAVVFSLPMLSGASPADRAKLSNLSLSHLNKAHKVIDSVSLPRTSAPLFRGVNGSHFHHDPAVVFRGMLGVGRYAMQSKVFNEMVTSQKISINEAIDNFQNYFSSIPRNKLENFYTKPNSPDYKNYADDAIFGSLFFEVSRYYANGYRAFVLAYHDYLKRGIDLNHVMGQLGNVQHEVDAGEYLMPLLIDESEIDGMIMPRTSHAYFRISDRGRRYLLVYQNAQCMFKNPVDEQFYHCSNKYLGDHHSPYEAPPQAMGIATASAVISVCKSELNCPLPNEDFLKKNSVVLTEPFALDVDTDKLSDSKNIVKVFWRPQ